MHFTLIIILCLVIYGCGGEAPRDTSLTQDEYDVYRSIIETHFGYRSDILKESLFHDSIFICQHTVPGRIFGERNYTIFNPQKSGNDTAVSLKWFSSSGEWDTLISNFKMVLKDSFNIVKSRLILPFGYLFLSEKDNVGNIESFKYNITISFSRAGFNLKRNEALVYFNIDEFEGGGSYTLLLRKNNNQWDVIQGYGHGRGMVSGDKYYNNNSIGVPKPAVPWPVTPRWGPFEEAIRERRDKPT